MAEPSKMRKGVGDDVLIGHASRVGLHYCLLLPVAPSTARLDLNFLPSPERGRNLD